MNNEQEIKEMVKEKYRVIAQQSKEQNQSSYCGSIRRVKEGYSV